MKVTIPTERAHRLLSPRVAYIITTSTAQGHPNAAAMSYVIPISEDPEAVLLSVTNDTQSYANLRATRQFVVNIADVSLLDSIWICGGHHAQEIDASRPDKFALASLTTIPSEAVKPPRILECFGHVECKVNRISRFGDHMLVIGVVVAASHSPGAFDSKQLLSSQFEPAMQLTGSHFVVPGTRYQPSEIEVQSGAQDDLDPIQTASRVEVVKE